MLIFYQTHQIEAKTAVSGRSVVAAVLLADNITPDVESHLC